MGGLSTSDRGTGLAKLDIPLERDLFLRNILRELAGTLQDVVGIEEASGFISVVGQHIGEDLNADYQQALALEKLDRYQVTDVLIDLKRRIHGDFYVIEEDEDKIVLGNRTCPFGDKVLGRPALCMMTSNVFGVIAAENLGYAKVKVEQAIATGSSGCRVVIYLKPSPGSANGGGREYFGS
jgi:predicted ArsR family transcriptional regulator